MGSMGGRKLVDKERGYFNGVKELAIIAAMFSMSVHAESFVLLGSTDFNGSDNKTDGAYAVHVDTNGYIVVAGFEWSTSAMAKWRIRKYDASLGTLVASTDYVSPAMGPSNMVSAIAVNSSGSYYFAGCDNLTGGYEDWRIRKYDASLGTLLASTGYSSPGDKRDYAYSVVVDSAGYVYVSGTSLDLFEGRVRKYDANLGALICSTDYHAGHITSSCIDGAGNLIVAGSISSPIPGDRDFCVRKYNSSLNVLIASTAYAGPASNMNEAFSVAIDGSGNIFVAGKEFGVGGNDDWCIRKYDSGLGNLLASTTYSGADNRNDYAYSIAITAGGDVVVGGLIDNNPGVGGDWCIRKYNASLSALLATTVYNGPGMKSDDCMALAMTGDGSLVAVGREFNSIATSYNWRINKYGFDVLAPAPPGSSTVVFHASNLLALTGKGAALDKNIFSPTKGEYVLVRINPDPGKPARKVNANVFTASGLLVKELNDGIFMEGGLWIIKWDGTSKAGSAVSRGVYLIRVTGAGIKEVLKVVVK